METVNLNKICFIACVNNDMYWEECLLYIDQLEIPEGFTVEVIAIREAGSITEGYNQGMRASDAKYKIYLHQDTYIVDRYFLIEMLEIFRSDPSVGMMGIVGSPKLPENAVMWSKDRVFSIYCEPNKEIELCQQKAEVGFGSFWEVEAIDGLLMATQNDLTWREDIFDGWHFYDISQSTEFRRAGLRVVVPCLHKPICIHDDGHIVNLKNYDYYRRKYLEHYKYADGSKG